MLSGSKSYTNCVSGGNNLSILKSESRAEILNKLCHPTQGV